jgi:hypothetical protein
MTAPGTVDDDATTSDERTPMPEHTARNGDEMFVFNGEELGHASTDDDGDLPRWTEITIWRTKAGKYVIEKVACSVVYHALDGCDRGIVRDADSSLDPDSQPCLVCKPDTLAADQVKIETNRYTTFVTENAPAAVEALRLTDSDPNSDGLGTVFMPNVARRALTEAAKNDDGIEDAFLTQRIA